MRILSCALFRFLFVASFLPIVHNYNALDFCDEQLQNQSPLTSEMTHQSLQQPHSVLDKYEEVEAHTLRTDTQTPHSLGHTAQSSQPAMLRKC